jgi:hypothetical protein
MNANHLKPLLLFLLSLSLNANGSNLADDAKDRGINETCYSYLYQIEKSYKLNGLNITFAHPENPSNLPSLHISSQIYNNGSSSFSATLNPDGEYCYVSTVIVTSIDNQNCSEIAKLKSESENLQMSSYGDGAFIILTPASNSYQTTLTSSGKNTCLMTEARMIWPGR